MTFGISIIVTLNQGSGILSALKFFKMDLFSLLDMLGSAFGLTLTAIFMVLFVIIVKKFEWFRSEANMGAKRFRVGKWMKWY